MTVVPFPVPLPPETRPPACDVTVTKDGRTRRYWIRRSPDGSEWWAQVFFGTTQHRAVRLADRYSADRLYAEYQREVAELQQDGWLTV